MAPLAEGFGVFAREDPAKIAAALGLPPGPDYKPLLLTFPAMVDEKSIPPGADRTMTVDGPDQIWFLVVAILCISFSGIFLMIRVYTKLAVVRSFELADCKDTLRQTKNP